MMDVVRAAIAGCLCQVQRHDDRSGIEALDAKIDVL